MSPTHVQDFWGMENLIRWSSASLRDLAIPEAAKAWLTHVGLPMKAECAFRFADATSPLPLDRVRPSLKRIGFDGPVSICIDEEHEGHIVADESAIGGQTRFMNASIQRFAAFLTLYEMYRRASRGVSESKAIEIVENVEKLMREIDPDALSDPNSYWSLILEQMRNALL